MGSHSTWAPQPTQNDTNISLQNGSMVMYVARDGLYKMGAENFHDQLLPNQPQKKSSTK